MTKVGPNKAALGRKINSMNQGDLPGFESVMTLAHEGLKKSSGNLKHMIIFSDGDPVAPSPQLMQRIVGDLMLLDVLPHCLTRPVGHRVQLHHVLISQDIKVVELQDLRLPTRLALLPPQPRDPHIELAQLCLQRFHLANLAAEIRLPLNSAR